MDDIHSTFTQLALEVENNQWDAAGFSPYSWRLALAADVRCSSNLQKICLQRCQGSTCEQVEKVCGQNPQGQEPDRTLDTIVLTIVFPAQTISAHDKTGMG